MDLGILQVAAAQRLPGGPTRVADPLFPKRITPQ